MNGTLWNISTHSGNNDLFYSRYQFLTERPEVAIPCLVILVLASLVGTFGNTLILIAVFTTQKLNQNLESIFIANLAISDLYVNVIADPMSVVGKLEGEEYFNSIPGLCQTIGYGCTIACVNSLMTIAGLSFNRYINICHHSYYGVIFRPWTCVAMCIGFYTVGSLLVLLNVAGIGDHSFDRKSLECVWDRMATYPYTVVFSITLVWIPVIVIGFSYLNIYLTVLKSQKKTKSRNKRKNLKKSSNLARALFIVYVIFAVCWIPYAFLIVVDYNDSFSHILHIFIIVLAHLHPSINWLVFYFTNRQFEIAFNRIAKLDKIRRLFKRNKDKEMSTTGGLSSTSGVQSTVNRTNSNVLKDVIESKTEVDRGQERDENL